MSTSDPHDTLSDGDIVRRIRLGEAVLYGILVERYRERLFRFTLRILASVHDAEDACQNTFVKVWKNLDRYDCDRAFSTWIFTIAYREACTLIARRRPSEPEFPELADNATAAADEAAAHSDTLEHLWLAAQKILPPKVYHMLWLHYGEDMPLGDIARVTGRTVVSVKVALFRARQKLAAQLGSLHDTAPAAAQQPLPTR